MTLSPTDWFAGIALIVSVVTVVITWKNHQDSGGRVKVRMHAAAYVPFAGTGKLVTNDGGAFLLWESREPAVELAQIVIENPGRTGVTVTGVQLRISGLDRGIYHVAPKAFRLEGFGGQEATIDTHFRLEPYDRKTLLLDYWSVVDLEFRKDPSLRELTIHAEVSVAGHDNPFDSTRHGYWRITRGFVSAIGDHTIRRPRNIIVTEFLRANSRDLSAINYMGQYAVTVEDTTDPCWSFSQFEEHLSRLLEHVSMDLVHLSDPPLLPHAAVLNIWNQYQALGAMVRPYPVLDHLARYYKERGLTPRS